jgi:hypothetical protein
MLGQVIEAAGARLVPLGGPAPNITYDETGRD